MKRTQLLAARTHDGLGRGDGGARVGSEYSKLYSIDAFK